MSGVVCLARIFTLNPTLLELGHLLVQQVEMFPHFSPVLDQNIANQWQGFEWIWRENFNGKCNNSQG